MNAKETPDYPVCENIQVVHYMMKDNFSKEVLINEGRSVKSQRGRWQCGEEKADETEQAGEWKLERQSCKI